MLVYIDLGWKFSLVCRTDTNPVWIFSFFGTTTVRPWHSIQCKLRNLHFRTFFKRGNTTTLTTREEMCLNATSFNFYDNLYNFQLPKLWVDMRNRITPRKRRKVLFEWLVPFDWQKEWNRREGRTMAKTQLFPLSFPNVTTNKWNKKLLSKSLFVPRMHIEPSGSLLFACLNCFAKTKRKDRVTSLSLQSSFVVRITRNEIEKVDIGIFFHFFFTCTNAYAFDSHLAIPANKKKGRAETRRELPCGDV